MLTHIPIAIAIMLGCWWLGHALGSPRMPAIWLGWIAGACACIMREVTQREYQWIEHEGDGRRANMPILEGLKVWDWNAHAIGQTLAALIVSAIVALMLSRL